MCVRSLRPPAEHWPATTHGSADAADRLSGVVTNSQNPGLTTKSHVFDRTGRKLMASTPATTAPVRYHPILVVLHWGLAVFILAALALGAFKMAPMPNTDPMKSEALRAHMTGGLVILVLMLLRLIARRATLHPPAASAGASALDRLARMSHGSLYLLVITMALSGLAMALQTGILSLIVGAHPGIPPDFWVFPVRSVHYLISRLLVGLITLHLAGALFHTFIRRDGLLRRMALGGRFAASATSVA